MKTVCKNNDYGAYYGLTIGKEYEVLDILEGIYDTPYVVVMGDNGKKVAAHNYRFDITREQADEYIKNKEVKGNA